MEKEKILQQLEDKLLPSVENLEKGQATEHDFFPALLWMLLEKNKDSQRLLQSMGSSNIDNFKKTVSHIVSQNKSLQQETNNSIENKVSILIQKLEELSNNNQNKFEEFSKLQEKSELKISKSFKWLLGFCIFQFITLTSLIIFMLIR